MTRISKRMVDGLKPSQDGRDVVVWDEKLPGFGVRMKPSGVVSYAIQYRNKHGTSRRFTLGRHGVLTADEARKMARDLLADVRRGGDPAESKSAISKDLTIRGLCDLYLEEGPSEKPDKKASSWNTDRSNIERHIKPLLGRRKLQSLTRNDVVRFQRDVTKGKSAENEKTKPRGRAIVRGGPGTAARATAVLGAMLGFAVKQGLIAENPAKGVELNKQQRRERFLSSKELEQLGEALANAENTGVNASAIAIIRLLILTGARRNEICGLKWQWVDFENAAIRLPDSKTGARTIPLGAPALEVLASVKRKPKIDWVFPAKSGGGHFDGLPRIWKKISSAAKLEEVRIHDLRHSFASTSVAGGSSLYIVGKVLGHTQARTTERYSHLDADPVLAVADATSRKIAAAMKSPPKKRKSNVRKLRS